MSAIDEVKQRIDIVDVIAQYTPLTKAGRNFRAICPFHNEKTPSFFVFPERQSWHCFGACNTGGDVFSFIMKKEGVDFPDALRRLAEKAGVTLPAWGETETRKEVKERLFQINDMAARYYQDLLSNTSAGEKARNYLQYRGINAGSITAFRLGYALDSWDALKLFLKDRGFTETEQVEAGLLSTGETGRIFDRWRHRLMYPIADEKGRVTGFGARVLESNVEGPKYINTSQTAIFDKSATLYGLNLAIPGIKQENAAVIVEGYMDVIAAHQYGFNNVVASMGTSITDKQVNSLKKLSRNLILALDSDSAGTEAMQRCVEHENTLEAEIKVVILPEGKDPDDVIKADQESWRQLVSSSTPVIDYTFSMVTAGLDLTKVNDRAKARDRLYPVVDGIKDIVRRAHYLQKLAGMIGVTDINLEASMRKKAVVRDRAGRRSDDTSLRMTGNALFKRGDEEYCLTLLIQHPDLREYTSNLPPEYFENSENREIYSAWLSEADLNRLKVNLDIIISQHYDELAGRKIPEGRIKEKFDKCILKLQEKYLKNMALERESFFSYNNEKPDSPVAIMPDERDIQIKNELLGVFRRRNEGNQVRS
jgi:DNA primase